MKFNDLVKSKSVVKPSAPSQEVEQVNQPLATVAAPQGEKKSLFAKTAVAQPARNPMTQAPSSETEQQKDAGTPAPRPSLFGAKGGTPVKADAAATPAPPAGVLESQPSPAIRQPLPGESPATAPARDLPEGLDDQQLGFVATLDFLPQIFDQTAELTQALQNIMIELQNRPELEEFIQDADLHIMMRGIRETLGIAQVKQAAAKEKRAASGSRKKNAAPVDPSILEGLFDGVDLNF